jgi:hypothetical protein
MQKTLDREDGIYSVVEQGKWAMCRERIKNKQPLL